jgi:hypothetical protein
MATFACMLGSAAAAETVAPTTFFKAAANVETAD